MTIEWVVSGAHYWRLYKRDVPRFMASLRRREDGWFEYCLRGQYGQSYTKYTKLEGLRTLEEAMDAVRVIVVLTESATNR